MRLKEHFARAHCWERGRDAAGIFIDDAPPSAGCGSPLEPERAAWMRTRHSVEVETAIEDFFAATKGGQWPVSVADGVRRVRAHIGRAAISETELAEMIRRYAATHGLEISPEPAKPRRRVLKTWKEP
jgi:hypothetical protein